MATTLNSFVIETQLGATEATLFSTSTSEKKFIGSAVATNTSENNVEITIWRLNSTTTGTTGSGGNWSFRKTIPAGQAIRIEPLIGQVLNKSMKVSGLAGTAAVVNINISGTTET